MGGRSGGRARSACEQVFVAQRALCARHVLTSLPVSVADGSNVRRSLETGAYTRKRKVVSVDATLWSLPCAQAYEAACRRFSKSIALARSVSSMFWSLLLQ